MAICVLSDIGGTNARFVLANISEAGYEKLKSETLRPQDFGTFKDCLGEFLKEQPTPKYAVIGAAGSIFEGSVRFVNTGWPVASEREIEEVFGIEHVKFLNDFVVAGYGVIELQESDLIQVNQGTTCTAKAVKAVLGPGTGLGECFLTWNGSHYDAWPSEGGHSDFVPKEDLDWKYAKYMTRKVEEAESEFKQFKPMRGVSNEICFAGVGAHHLYYFLKEEFPDLLDPEFDQFFEAEPRDRLKNIMEYGFSGKNELCVRAVEMWLKFLAYETGNMVCKTLPYGGVYIIGGVVMKNAENIANSQVFKEALFSKPPHICEIIRNCPVYVVTNEEVGFLGTIRYAKNLLNID